MGNWEKNIRKVEPYVPGEQPRKKVIKLNTNENPYPPAPGVEKVFRTLGADELRFYPDPTNDMLVCELAKCYGVKKEQVFVGVGSDDVLAMSFLTFFHSEKPILFPDLTYSFYKVWAELFEIPYECPKLDQNFCIRREDYYKENGGIIFPNPNAPTGIYEDLEFIEDILKNNEDVVVIIDEAYIDFAGPSAICLLEKYDNLLVVQTFSKARSMAGMRIGYALGNEKLIQYLNDVKYSFNSYTMSRPALLAGVESVKDRVYFEEKIQEIIQTREWAKTQFAHLGFTFPDSKANFLFVTHPEYNAKEIFEELKEKDVYVRYFGGDRTGKYLRVSIGTKEEMEKFFRVLSQILAR